MVKIFIERNKVKKYTQQKINDLIIIENDKVYIKDIDFTDCDLSELCLSEIVFINCDLSFADLSFADLTRANLNYTNLSNSYNTENKTLDKHNSDKIGRAHV